MFKGLIFDFDGTILDTETPEFNIWQDIFRSYHSELFLEDWLKGVGTSPDVFNVFSHLEEKVGKSLDRERVRKLHRKKTLNILNKLTLRPGIKQYLQFAESHNIKLAVASSSDLDWVKGHLNRLNLTSKFSQISGSDYVDSVKPDPAVYLHALNGLSLRPQEVVAIEDSVNGVIAAKAAGLYCIAVPNQITKSLDFSLADQVLDSLDMLQPQELYRTFKI
ncbi:MAG: HAD family hydrolase [Anaerolineaceae bacterium]|nr:HAD family hydrolase [Anaerolineaceae bacterium]